MNNLELRFPNEPARHKLIGCDWRSRPDRLSDQRHASLPTGPAISTNVEFAKKIKQYIKKNKHIKGVPAYDPNQPPVYDQTFIEKKLPHRFPFLLVDKIIELSDTHIVGVKT